MQPFSFMFTSVRALGSFVSRLDLALAGVANGLGATLTLLGSLVRLMNTGRVQQYLLFALIGLCGAAAWLILS